MLSKPFVIRLASSLLLSLPLLAGAEGFYGGLNLGVGMSNLKTPNGVDKAISMRVGWDHYKAEVDVNGASSKSFDSNVTTIGVSYHF